MAQTTDLLALVDEFSTAFADPDAQATLTAGSPAVSHAATDSTSRTQQLLQLMESFAPAFANPETAAGSQGSEQEDAEHVMAPTGEATSVAVSDGAESPSALPAGSTQALHRQLATMGWGQIDVYLSYGDDRLQSMWIVVGKSGTEVQSLCEAIARLINLLLAQQVPIPAITRQIRGIRGADSEGLGPHRFLGLADLMGKVLQEAPASWGITPQTEAGLAGEMGAAIVASEVEAKASASMLSDSESIVRSHDLTWASLPEDGQAAALCPECGAELQVMNGCSGGACNVCGYSSCS